ncbi:ROK family transcriptional regulator [Halarsenatibacter silvermanii]|uniref:ROK family protein (Putative glucokinase) n=1 Tax=Halarsenatibacter silvermanii TaxID=321763 RepID=A0A1G9GV98_9FIRM|nr:ROK family protein [Halarsenatibacter silvermanii]SDL04524.1 ROK family protein (putative glucokinase) [Halarsenatibacter silvermanii]
MLSQKNDDERSVKEINQSRILQSIKIHDSISRIELAEEIDLNPSTITRLVKKLEKFNLVREIDLGKSRGGRRPVKLGIDESTYRVIGVDVGATEVIAVLINLAGEVLHKIVLPIEYKEAKREVEISPEVIEKSIEKLLSTYSEKERRQELENILGIGVGVHGLVDRDEGLSIFAPNFGWRNINFKKKLTEKFRMKTIIDNDVRVMALGEYWFGHGQNVDNLICINAGYGIGSGIIIEGELYRGHNSLAGEFGHTNVEKDGQLCSCGDYGCLETLASGPALVKRIRREIKRGMSSKIIEMTEGELSEISGEMISAAARKDDELARRILKKAGNYLGMGIANLINIFDPELILIGGGVSRAGPYIFAPLHETVARKTMNSAPEIKKVQLGEDCGAVGAGVLVIEELFRRPETFMEEIACNKPTIQ